MVIEKKKIETSGSDLSNCSSGSSPPKSRRSPSESRGSPLSPNNKSRDTSLDSLVEAMDISSSSTAESSDGLSSSAVNAVAAVTATAVAKPIINGHHCQKRPNSDEKSEESEDSDEMIGGGGGHDKTTTTTTNNHHHHHHHHHHHPQDSIKVKRNSVTNGHDENGIADLASGGGGGNGGGEPVSWSPTTTTTNQWTPITSVREGQAMQTCSSNNSDGSDSLMVGQGALPGVVVGGGSILSFIASTGLAEEQQQQQQQQPQTPEQEVQLDSRETAKAEAQPVIGLPTPISILLNEEDVTAFNSSSQASLLSNGIGVAATAAAAAANDNEVEEDEQQKLIEELTQSLGEDGGGGGSGGLMDSAASASASASVPITTTTTITVSTNFSQIIELPLSKLKSNCNEFPSCHRIYLYVCDVYHSDSKYEADSMELYFQTSDAAFNAANCPPGVENPVYKLALSFPRGIVPEKCSHIVKKKSIEINLEKASQTNWGSLGVKCRTTLAAASPVKSSMGNFGGGGGSSSFMSGSSSSSNSNSNSIYFKSPIATFSPNQWTPFATAAAAAATATGSSNSSSSDGSDSLMGLDSLYGSGSGGPSSNSLALVTYEEPVEPVLLLDDPTARGKFYGYTGLDNLGNTCFMNSVLQCLSNTYPLRDYFLSGQFRADINDENPLGTRGVIARAFAYFLKQMWLGKQSSFAPSRIKSLTGEKITSIFLGYGQHDAQEFMSFFLDAIHEDLNQNQNRPKVDHKKAAAAEEDEEESNPEKELFDERDLVDESRRAEMQAVLRAKADAKWREYRLFNSSLVIDLFCGQYQSVLSCPDCNKKSIMFDPFLYIPLPIPPAKVPYEVIFFGREEATGVCRGSARYEILLAHNATAGDLLAQVSAKAGVPKSKMRLIEQQEEHISPKFLNSHLQHLSDLRSNDSAPSFKSRPLLVFEVYKDSAEEYVELCVIQRSLEKMQPRRFLPISNGDPRVGLPFIITVRRSQLTYHHLCTVICSYAAHSVSAFRTKMLSLPPPTTSITGGILPGLRSSSSSSTQQVFTFNLSEFCRTFESTASSESNASNTASASTSSAASTSSSSSTLPPPPPPHFVHFQTAPLSPASNDVLAPFIIRRTNLGVNKEAPEAEVAPPLLMIRTTADEEMAPAASDDSDMSDASEASTVVGGGGGGGGGNETSSSADEDFQQQQQQQGQATGFEVASQHSSSRSSSSGFKSATSSESDGASSSSSSSSASALESVLEMRMRRHGHGHHHHPPHHHQLPSLTEQAAMLSTKMEQDLPEGEEEEEEEPLDDDDQVEGAEDEDEDDDDEYEDENGEIRSSKDSSRDKRTSTASAAAAVSVQFDNDRPLDLGDVYYLCADWIDVAGFPRGVGVSLSESYTTSTTRHSGGGFMNSFSAGSRSLLFGGGGSSSKFSASSDDDDDDISLDDCFQLFSEPEVLGQANCWKCPACRAPRAATKQLSFNLRRLPPILVVQLKRFKMAPNSIHRRKLGQLVKFPISGLDLRKMQQPGQDLCGGGGGENSLDNVPPPIYDLYAVVNHMGEAFMGHYTAYARAFNGEMGWRHFDDSSVSDVTDESRIVSHNAYLLFYKRREKEKKEDKKEAEKVL